MGIYDQLDQLEKSKTKPISSEPARPATPAPLSAPALKTNQPINERPNGRISEARTSRIPERTNVRPLARVQIRHTFDIFKDQLNALQTIQLEAVTTGLDKPTLGELIQQALDEYLQRRSRKKSTNDPYSERATERSDE